MLMPMLVMPVKVVKVVMLFDQHSRIHWIVK